MEKYLPFLTALILAPLALYLEKKSQRFKAYWLISTGAALLLLAYWNYASDWMDHAYLPLFFLLWGLGQLYESAKGPG